MYFERLVLGTSEAKLSLLTVGRLTPDLQKIKRSLGIPIVSLEDAVIELSKTSFEICYHQILSLVNNLPLCWMISRRCVEIYLMVHGKHYYIPYVILIFYF